jgi:hypothetical protein
LTTIRSLLGIVIKAPYQQAVMHLREGELEKCKDKLIEAISLDELNLPAMLLYANILRFNQNYILALDVYWDVLEKFGFRQDLVPLPLFEAYRKKFFESRIYLDNHSEIIVSFADENYPQEVWCSLSGFVIRWKGLAKILGIVVYEWSTVKGYSWTEKSYKEVFYASQGNPSIGTVTNHYAVVQESTNEFVVYRLKDGSKVPKTLSSAEFNKLFRASEELKPMLDKCRTNNDRLVFAGLEMNKDIHVYITKSSVTPMGGHGGSGSATVRHQMGRLIIRP